MIRTLLTVLSSLSLLGSAGLATGQEPESPKFVTAEITIFELSGHLAVQNPDDVKLDMLQEAVKAARSSGVFQHLTRVRLTALESMSASLQLGATERVVTGRTVSQFNRGSAGSAPRVVNTLSEQSTGTHVTMRPLSVRDDRVALVLQVEQTRKPTAPDDDEDVDGEDDGDADRAGLAMLTLSFENSVLVPIGRSVLVAASQKEVASGEPLHTYVFLHVSIGE